VWAYATDPLDGYFARSRREVTVLGAFLDPLADKLLTMSAFIVMVKYQPDKISLNAYQFSS